MRMRKMCVVARTGMGSTGERECSVRPVGRRVSDDVAADGNTAMLVRMR